jgi:hypothetical protein
MIDLSSLTLKEEITNSAVKYSEIRVLYLSIHSALHQCLLTCFSQLLALPVCSVVICSESPRVSVRYVLAFTHPGLLLNLVTFPSVYHVYDIHMSFLPYPFSATFLIVGYCDDDSDIWRFRSHT